MFNGIRAEVAPNILMCQGQISSHLCLKPVSARFKILDSVNKGTVRPDKLSPPDLIPLATKVEIMIGKNKFNLVEFFPIFASFENFSRPGN